MLRSRPFLMLGLGVCVCAGAITLVVLARSSGAGAPDVATIQKAYDSEEATGNPEHDKSVKIADATCGTAVSNSYSCMISYWKNTGAERKLYYDVAIVTHDGPSWILKSGICKHDDGQKNGS